MRKAALNKIFELGKENPSLIFIGSDLGHGTLAEFKEKLPDQFYMEGVSEAHIIGMAAGLAHEGNIVYINTIASFLTRRCLEQIIIDLCLENLPVRLLGSGGGGVYGPLGPTHTIFEDVALMRAIPNMTVVLPSDANQMSQIIEASIDYPGPMYIRFGKGGDSILKTDTPFSVGKAQLLFQNTPCDILLIATGVMTQRAVTVSNRLKELKINSNVINLHTLKPLDTEKLKEEMAKSQIVFTLEEHGPIGGLASAVSEIIAEDDLIQCKFRKISLPDTFVPIYGRQEELLAHYHMDDESLFKRIYESICSLQ